MMIASLLLGLAATEHPDSWNCTDIEDHDQATMCARERLSESSADLTFEHGKMLELMARIDEDGRPVGFSSDLTAAEEFRRAHEQWITFRNSNCYFEGRLALKALRIPLTVLLCRARMNWDRADQFRFYQIMARDPE